MARGGFYRVKQSSSRKMGRAVGYKSGVKEQALKPRNSFGLKNNSDVLLVL